MAPPLWSNKTMQSVICHTDDILTANGGRTNTNQGLMKQAARPVCRNSRAAPEPIQVSKPQPMKASHK